MKHFLSLLLLLFLSLSVGLSLSAQDTACIRMKTEARPLPESVNNYDRVLSDALSLQLKSDSLARIARDKRVIAKGTPDEELKKQLITEIIRVERESKKLQRDADVKFAEAWKMKGNENNLISEDSMLVLTKEIENTRVYNYNSYALPPEKETETLVYNPPEQPVKTTDVANVTSDEFRIMDKSIYNPSNPIPKGLVSHKGLVYLIQLGVFSKARPDDSFGGICPVCYEQGKNSTILKYYAGLFFSLKGVMDALDRIKKNGFPDAFIVAFFDDKPITTEKAKEIEFEGMRL